MMMMEGGGGGVPSRRDIWVDLIMMTVAEYVALLQGVG